MCTANVAVMTRWRLLFLKFAYCFLILLSINWCWVWETVFARRASCFKTDSKYNLSIIIMIIIIILIIIMIIIPRPVLVVLPLWHRHSESSPSSFDECRTLPSGCRHSDLANQLGPWTFLQAAVLSSPHTIAICNYFQFPFETEQPVPPQRLVLQSGPVSHPQNNPGKNC